MVLYACPDEFDSNHEAHEINNVANSIESIIDDMKKPHDEKPHGVPNSFDWSKGATAHHIEDVDSAVLSKFHALVAWGQAYEAASGNPAKNTRVQIRNIKAYVLSKKDKKWHLAQSYSVVDGASYREDFLMDINKSADMRKEKDSGGISVKIGEGYNFHFFAPQRASFNSHDVMGIFSTIEARLIVDNPKLPDDRDQARILLNMGCDLWKNLSNELPAGQAAPEVGMGRFKYVTKNWKPFNMITLTEAQTRKYAPPVK